MDRCIHRRLGMVFVTIAAALGGCTVGFDDFGAPPPAITVERIDHGSVEVSRDGLDSASAFAVEQRIAELAGTRPEALNIFLVGASERTRQDIAAIAANYGVPDTNVRRSRPTGVAKVATGGTFVIFSTYVAHPPECEQRVLAGAPIVPNTVDAQFGCATLVDLALSVANPRDLIGRESVVFQDGERAAVPVAAYRNPGAIADPPVATDGPAPTLEGTPDP